MVLTLLLIGLADLLINMSDSKIKLKTAQDLISQKLNYTFENTDLISEAITHKSISKTNYERLEFLGDAVLQLIISKYLFRTYPDYKEGYLSREKQSLVSKKIISKVSLNLGLLDILRSNNLDVDSNLSLRDSLAADILESLIGAIFLDSSYSQTEKVIIDAFGCHLDKIQTIGEKDPKTQLQEYLQSLGLPLPKYMTTKIKGPAHNPEFKITCTIKIYNSPEYVTSKTVQAGQQAVSQIFLNKIKNE